jgi:hypothetical protein
MMIFMGIKPESNKSLSSAVKQSEDCLVIIHQNIKGLANKTDELNCSMVTRNISPHLICLSEHDMTDLKLSYCNLPNYVLGTSYARTTHQGGGIFFLICIVGGGGGV